jgi:excisionase family DNA binding protein
MATGTAALDERTRRSGSVSVQTTTAALAPLTAADVLCAGEVAELLHVPVSTVHDWARRGLLPSRKIGRRRLYIRQQIEAVLLGGDELR